MRAPWLVASTLGGWLLGAASGCERLLSIQDPVAGDRSDAGSGIDADIDAPVVLPASSPVLLSEVVVSPSEAEMIEIVNTSNQSVDLSTYFLSDSAKYYTLPSLPSPAPPTSVDMTDFIVGFPNGTQLGPYGVLTVAVDTPSNFAGKYSRSPDFSVTDTSMKRIAVNGTPRITDTGEPIILFQWDGRSNLVRDVDIMIVGNPAPGNQLTNKSGLAPPGPDPSLPQAAYATDANTIPFQTMAPMPTTTMPPVILSTQRVLLEDGHEHQNVGGNGQSGDDETSEDTSVTWTSGTTANPFTPATPGTAPDALKR